MADYKLMCWMFIITMAYNGVRLCHSQSETTAETGIAWTTPSLMQEVEDNSRYKTQEANATLLKLLVDDEKGVSRSEVFDMLDSRDQDPQHVDLPTFSKIDGEDSRADVPSVPDSQAEFLQVPGLPVRRDSERMRFSSEEPVGTAAVVMIVVTCSIVCLAYTALVLWRRIYLKRNGLKHELLRNEDVFTDTRIEL